MFVQSELGNAATTHRPATGLVCLLYKNPARSQVFSFSFGTAQVFYLKHQRSLVDAALAQLVEASERPGRRP